MWLGRGVNLRALHSRSVVSGRLCVRLFLQLHGRNVSSLARLPALGGRVPQSFPSLTPQGLTPPSAISCVYQLCPAAQRTRSLWACAWTAVWGLPAPGPQGHGAECHLLSLSPALPSVPRPPEGNASSKSIENRVIA